MRRIIVFNRVSADGYFAGPDGSLDWVVPDNELDKDAMGSGVTFDTVLFGRRTYELFSAYWPNALKSYPAVPNPHDARGITPETRKMAEFLNAVKKIVFSRTLRTAEWENTTIIRDLSPAAIEGMKKEQGDDMIMFGSGSIVSMLTQHRLIDEYQLIVTPVFIGSGKPMISGIASKLSLDLKDVKRYPSGNILLRYTPASGRIDA